MNNDLHVGSVLLTTAVVFFQKARGYLKVNYFKEQHNTRSCSDTEKQMI